MTAEASFGRRRPARPPSDAANAPMRAVWHSTPTRSSQSDFARARVCQLIRQATKTSHAGDSGCRRSHAALTPYSGHWMSVQLLPRHRNDQSDIRARARVTAKRDRGEERSDPGWSSTRDTSAPSRLHPLPDGTAPAALGNDRLPVKEGRFAGAAPAELRQIVSASDYVSTFRGQGVEPDLVALPVGLRF